MNKQIVSIDRKYQLFQNSLVMKVIDLYFDEVNSIATLSTKRLYSIQRNKKNKAITQTYYKAMRKQTIAVTNFKRKGRLMDILCRTETH